MSKKRLLVISSVLIIFCYVLNAGENEKYKVIVNGSNTIQTISKVKLSQFFLKKTNQWKDGNEVFPVDLIMRSLVRQNFTLNVHQKNVDLIKAYWTKQIFKGESVPPPQMVLENDILDFVQSNPGAIGYVSSKTSINGYNIKVVSIVD